MKISIFYYSGAGNTKFISKKIASSLKQNFDITNQRITTKLINNIYKLDSDIIGIGFPIYFRRPPELVVELLKKLEGNNKRIFFFCTKGLYSGNAIKQMMELSKKRGFVPLSYIEFYMPGTDALLLLAKKGSFTEKFFRSIYSRNIDKKIVRYTEKILHNHMDIPKRKWYTFLDMLIVEKFEIIWSDQNKKLISRFYSKKDVCIQCMKCVRGCPRNNIIFDEYIRFGSDCDTCFYCVHHCPVEAIQIGNITENTVRYNKVSIKT